LAREVLRVVEPAAVDAALRAARDLTAERDDAIAALELELEAARYAAEKAWRQYDAADPENRLVAGELEHRWNSALKRACEIEERIDSERARRDEARPADPDSIRSLAHELPRVWNHPEADARRRKRIARAVIEEVVVDVDAPAGEVELVVHWKGGVHTESRIRRRRRGESRQAAPSETVDAVRALALTCTDTMMAGYLNRNGLRSGKGNRWTRERVTSLRSKRDIPCHSPERKRSEGWMTLTEASRYAGVGSRALRCAAGLWAVSRGAAALLVGGAATLWVLSGAVGRAGLPILSMGP
jgi:hypothetical protein